MIRAMSSSVSGLKNMQTQMDIIGNNISNVNTPGFKKSRVVFQDQLYQSMKGSSAPQDSQGGTNAMAVGMGMTVGSVDQIHTQGQASATNNPTDMDIDGDGYFIIKNASGESVYSRAGAFNFDEAGNLVTSDGSLVQGWLADASNSYTIKTSPASLTNINISSYNMTVPKPTSTMTISGNLDSSTEGYDVASTATSPFDISTGVPDSGNAVITSKEFYDSLGNKGTIYYRFFKVVDSSVSPQTSQWNCDVSLSPLFPADSSGNFTLGGSTPTDTTTMRIQNIKFKTDGSLDTSTGNTTSFNNLTIDRSMEGADPVIINVDLSKLQQFSSSSTAWADSQNGAASGTLKSYSVGTDGTISAVYDNDEKRDLCRVALASFQNPAGLQQLGSNMWAASKNSGDAQIAAPGNEGMGAIIPQSLEMSNVDLSEEMTQMIVTERGFQANSRIITTSDEMLQALVNLGK